MYNKANAIFQYLPYTQNWSTMLKRAKLLISFCPNAESGSSFWLSLINHEMGIVGAQTGQAIRTDSRNNITQTNNYLTNINTLYSIHQVLN